MISRNSIYFLSIIILVGLNNNCFEYLNNQAIHAPQILFYRGIFTIVITTAFAVFRKESFFPKNIRPQAVRFVTTGGALLLILESYTYLSAGTVSLLQRLDIPFLILLSIVNRQKKKRFQILLSIITVLIVLFLTINPSLINEDLSGFLLVFSGVGMTAIGYITLHKGSQQESAPSLINISGISSIIFGLVLIQVNHFSWSFPIQDFLIILLSSVINIFLFYCTIELYKVYTPERALLPFVWAILVTAILEMIIEQKLYSIQDILILVILTFLISAICLGSKKRVTNEQIF